ncbi:GDYXXLXY domain-containing protein [Anoxybacteroides tepidamans]|uniref:GDYXXLXY domain-containing protein n=1 Tax=Anoxybacteroides tepidamans TaxID=265948 RepID=UPI00048914B7|nr:GDYXXLXY domain-containing protein [Anoxybacillus tepidamans]
MTERWIRAGYLMGVVLVLTSIVYFFASNWPGFERLTKVTISIGLIWLFYGTSFLLAHIMNRHDFLSRWMFVAGAVAFGISVGLIGQIYNSHADSFWLFLVWLIPSSVLAWLARYEPLRVLSVILLQLLFWFYYFPSSYHVQRSEWESFLLLLAFAVVNGVIFVFREPSFVSYLLYIAMQGWLFFIFVHGLIFDQFVWWPYVYSLLLAAFLYYFFKVSRRRSYILITSIFAGMFVIFEYFRFTSKYFQEGVFFAGLLLSAAIIYGSVLLLKRLKSISSEKLSGTVFLFAFQMIVTVVASLIATSSIMGLILIWTGHFSPNLLFGLSVVLFVVPSMLVRSWNHVVRGTLLAVGYGMGAIASSEISGWLLGLYIAILLVAYFISTNAEVRLLTNIALSIYGTIFILNWTDEVRLALLFVVLLNGCLYVLSRRRKYERFLPQFIGLGAFLLLTSMDFFKVDSWYVCSNIAFVLVVIGWIMLQTKSGERWGAGIAWFYWWLFLIFKYYEWAWDLLHKSTSLFILGVFFLVGTAVLERNRGYRQAEETNWLRSRWISLFVVVMLQTVFTGYVVFDKEQHLRHGEVVKLQLAPVDPRSFLQGDYVRLRYEISQIRGLTGRGKVQIVLRKDEKGVYRFTHVYAANGKKDESYERHKNDVFINGTLQGDTVVYGIESFFVPEKTGADVQQNARYAYVRVSKTGDALLEKVSNR